MNLEDVEVLYQAINRFSALSEQYDMLEQTLAQVEMQREILYRVPESKQIPGSMQQVVDQLGSAEAYRDAVLRLIKDSTGKTINELRQALSELRLALSRYSELQNECSKVKQAFDILLETEGFANKDFLVSYLRRLVLNCINPTPLVTPTDSVLGPLIRQKDKEIGD